MPVNSIPNHDTQTPSIRELSLEEVEAVGGGNSWINIIEGIGEGIAGNAIWAAREAIVKGAGAVAKAVEKGAETVGKDAEKVGKAIFHKIF